MTPSRPYLIRAIYEWIVDNGCTPYINVDTTVPRTSVPGAYIRDNTIILDISSEATSHLVIDNNTISFKARFGGISQELYIPIQAVNEIYAQVDKEHNKPQFNIISGGKDRPDNLEK